MTTSTSASPEWIRGGRRKWRKLVTNHRVLTPEEKLILLSFEDMFPEGKTTLGAKSFNEFMVNDATRRAVYSAQDYELISADSNNGKFVAQLLIPVSIGWAAWLCEQKHQREASEVKEDANA